MYQTETIRTSAGVGSRSRTTVRWGGILFCGVLVSVALGAADSDTKPVGLRGILPAEVPEDLASTLSQLKGNWEKWVAGVSADLATLYETEDVDLSGQRKVLAALRARLKVLETALADPRYRSIKDQLVSLHGGLRRRLDVADATLDTLGLDPATAKADQLKEAKAQVAQAMTELDAYLHSIPNGEGWLKYIQADKLSGVLRPNDGPQAATPVLQIVHSRLKGENVRDQKTQTFLHTAQFAALDRAVDGYLSIAAKESEPVNLDDLRSQFSTLVGSLETYETSPTTDAATAARGAFNAIRKLAADQGARISRALQNNYFNYNLQVFASEAFLSRHMSERHDEAGGVRDFILGADVYGNQVTNSVAGVQLLPNPRAARFAVTLNGTVSSNTSGVTSQATIFTQGYHTFYATKEVTFDGNRFVTGRGDERDFRGGPAELAWSHEPGGHV